MCSACDDTPDRSPAAAAAPPRLTLFRRFSVTAFDPKGFDPERQSETSAAQPRIRCPHCRWQPERGSRWYCFPMGAPEHFSGGCGTAWNTFDTGGKCPGCRYQWTYTSCLHCERTALHIDWYETDGEPRQ